MSNVISKKIPGLDHLRFLVVDDHMLMRNMVKQNLVSLGGVSIDMASTGKEAWKKIETARHSCIPYHVVFLDWHMPEMEGIELLKLCRESDDHKKTAIVMLTAEQSKQSVLEAIEIGATSYIVKPLSFEQFVKNLEKITEWLKKHDPDYADLAGKSASDKSPSNGSTYSSDNKRQSAKELEQEIAPILTQGIENIFSELFDVDIISNESILTYAEKEMVAVGKLHEDDFEIVMRFVFDKALLIPLLRQFYSPQFLEKDETYIDAACEVVNILSCQVKAYLNERGYNLTMDLPEIGAQDHKVNSAHSVLNVRFCLNDADSFLIDVSTQGERAS